MSPNCSPELARGVEVEVVKKELEAEVSSTSTLEREGKVETRWCGEICPRGDAVASGEGEAEATLSARRKGLRPRVGRRRKVEDEGRASCDAELFRCRPREEDDRSA